MDKRFRIIVLLMLLSGLASAGNLSGGDIWYSHLSASFYRVHVRLYAECSSTLLMPGNITVQVQSTTSPVISFQQTLGLSPQSGTIVTSLCPTALTTCDGGSLYGLREYHYHGVISLTPNDWTIAYTGSYRNTLNNIINSTQQEITLVATLDNSQVGNFSSPAFISTPPVFLCTDQENNVSNRCGDLNEDSLAYSLVPMLGSGAGQVLAYVNGYSFLTPFGNNVPFQFNPSSGEITVIPSTAMVAGFAIMVEKFRNIGGVSVRIGSSMRDFQLHASSCVNQLPRLSGINPAATQFNPTDTVYHISICAEELLVFKLFAYDSPDVDNPSFNSMYISWFNPFAGPSFYTMNQGSVNPIGYFVWQPTNLNAANSPYYIDFMVTDNNCPYPGTRMYTYRIDVIHKPDVSLGNDITVYHDQVIQVPAVSDLTNAYYYWKLNGALLNVPMTTSQVLLNSGNLLPGLHQLSVHMLDPGQQYCDAHDTIAVYVKKNDLISGLEHANGQPGISVSPVPLTSESRLELMLPDASGVECLLTDITGRSLMQICRDDFDSGYHQFSLSEVANYPAGAYLLVIRTSTGTHTRKLLVR